MIRAVFSLIPGNISPARSFSYRLQMANRILQQHFRTRIIKAIVFPQPLKEVPAIRNTTLIKLITYYPQNQEGQLELANRVSDVHATAVTQRIKSLNCPTSQKLALWDAVMETVKKRSREQT